MTIGPRSQCAACVHLKPRASLSDPFACDAFEVIPDAVYGNDLDHRQPIDGDHGVQFEALVGDEFPAYAFI